MVKVKLNNKEYVLRFDLGVMEWMDERYGSYVEGFKEIQSMKRDALNGLFREMVNAAYEYRCMGDRLMESFEIIGRRASLVKVKKVVEAIMETIKSSSKAQTIGEDDDDTVHDLYLEEIEAEESSKNAAEA